MKTLMISVVIITVTIVTGTVLVMILTPDREVAPLIGLLAPTITSLAGLAGIALVKGDTAKMTNGFMDDKIKTNVREVIHEESEEIS